MPTVPLPPAFGNDTLRATFPGALRPQDRPAPTSPPPLPASADEPPAPGPRRLRALPPEPEPELPGNLPDEMAPPAAPDRFSVLPPEPEPVRRRWRPDRRLTIGAGVVLLLLAGGIWLLAGGDNQPATPPAEPAAATAGTPAAETPEPEPGLTIGTVWTRVPVAVVDGSAGRVTADGPFRIRVDGTVYTLSGEAMPIIPVTPDSRVEARAVSGNVVLRLTP